MSKTIVIYYSYTENTKRIAERISQAIGADLAAIEMVKPYGRDYNTVVDQGQEEVTNGYKPELKPLSVDLTEYETVILGTPTWWYTMAPAMLSFISANDWTGKTVIPFITNGGWPGHVIKDIKANCKGAIIKNEKEIRFGSTELNQMETSIQELDAWIASIK